LKIREGTAIVADCGGCWYRVAWIFKQGMMIHTQLLKESLERGRAAGSSYVVLRDDLVLFQENGGTQEAALALLYQMREACTPEDEEWEDTLLDLMDFVTGYCQPKWRIW
jgi:hypothetical protein